MSRDVEDRLFQFWNARVNDVTFCQEFASTVHLVWIFTCSKLISASGGLICALLYSGIQLNTSAPVSRRSFESCARQQWRDCASTNQVSHFVSMLWSENVCLGTKLKCSCKGHHLMVSVSYQGTKLVGSICSTTQHNLKQKKWNILRGPKLSQVLSLSDRKSAGIWCNEANTLFVGENCHYQTFTSLSIFFRLSFQWTRFKPNLTVFLSPLNSSHWKRVRIIGLIGINTCC